MRTLYTVFTDIYRYITIIIFSKTFEDHIRDLRAVFTRLREAGLTLKLPKCSFAKDTVHYLGYILYPETALNLILKRLKALQI